MAGHRIYWFESHFKTECDISTEMLVCKEVLCWASDRCKNEAYTTFGRRDTSQGLKCGDNWQLTIHSEALTIVPTFKGVGLYSVTFLHVRTMVNAPLCCSFYLFLYFLPFLHLYIVQFVCLFVTYSPGCHQTLREYKVGHQKCPPLVEIVRLAVLEYISFNFWFFVRS